MIEIFLKLELESDFNNWANTCSDVSLKKVFFLREKSVFFRRCLLRRWSNRVIEQGQISLNPCLSGKYKFNSRFFCTFLCPPGTNDTWNDQSLSWLENGNSKAINFTMSLWILTRFPLFSSNLTDPYFQVTKWLGIKAKIFWRSRSLFFRDVSLESSLSDRKVPILWVSTLVRQWVKPS